MANTNDSNSNNSKIVNIQNSNCGLSSFINSTIGYSKPLLGHNKKLQNITKEEIERIKNELSTETKLHEASNRG